MPIIASDSGKSFELCPTGVQRAICSFVVDIGLQETTFGTKHQVVIVWELESKKQDGSPFTMSRYYNLSLNEKATLRHDLESWRGRAFTEEEVKGFDLEKLKEAPALMNIIESKKQDGNVTRKIGAIMPLPKGTEKIQKVLTKIPEWLEKKISGNDSNSFMNDTPPQEMTPPAQDDLPF